MTRMDEIRDLYAYTRWANRRVLDAAARLSPEQLSRDLGSSFPSVRETLAHVLAGEWIWLTRWRGSSPPGLPESWDLSSLEVVRAQWAEVEADQRAFVEGLDEAALDRVVAYRDTRGDPYENPLGQLLRHVVNHSTYHRGQVITMLRQLGAEAVATDYVVYLRQRAG
jgi:uncharacterized damage-inducible protein DinB